MKRPVTGPAGMHDGPSARQYRSARAAYALVLAAAVLLSAAYLILYARRIPFYASPVVDARIYDQWARAIASGDWLSRAEGVFYRAPFYPYLLAGIYAIFGRAAPWMQLLQAALTLGTILLSGLLAQRLAGRIAGLVAMILLALYGPLLAAESKLLPTTTGLFLHLSTLLLALRFAERPGCRRGIFAGGVLGLSALVRPQWILFGAVLPAILPFAGSSLRRFAWKTWIPFWAGLLLVVGPVTVRNGVVFKDWVPISSNGGMTFYQGNNEENHSGLLTIVRKFELFGSATQQRVLETRVAERETGRSLRPSQTSAFWTRQALSFITGHPLSWLVLEGRKLYRIVTSFEYADNYSYTSERERLWPLRVAFVPAGLILALGVAGALLRGGEPRARRTALASAVFGIAGCLAFYVSSRYRMDGIPGLAVLGGAGVAGLAKEGWRGRGRVIPVVAAAVFAASFLPAGAPARSQESITYLQLGNALEAQKRFREAEQAYRTSVLLQPENAYSWDTLALLVCRLDGPGRADSLLTSAPPVVRDHPLSLYTRGYLETKLEREDEAVSTFEAALAANPLMKEAHYNLAMLEEKRREYARAASELEEALRLGQDDADLLAHLTYVRIQLRRYAEARASALALLRLRPSDPDGLANLAISSFFLGDLAEARKRLDQARALSDSAAVADPLLSYYAGLVELREGRPQEAASELAGALSADPSNHRALYYLTLCRSAGGRLERAWPQWKAAWEEGFGVGLRPALPAIASYCSTRAATPWGAPISDEERTILKTMESSPEGERVAGEILRFRMEESGAGTS